VSPGEKRVNAEKIKQEIITLIDENREPIYKAVFYSKPEVQSIMNRIMEVWERSGGEGRPIDYATIDELEQLLKIAKEIVKKSPEELMAEYWGGRRAS
jgi:lipoate-protein ligase A